MRRYLPAILLLTSLVLPIVGCGDGIAYSSAERRNTHRRIREIDRRQLVDDWDYLWLNDQPGRLSRWAIE